MITVTIHKKRKYLIRWGIILIGILQIGLWEVALAVDTFLGVGVLAIVTFVFCCVARRVWEEAPYRYWMWNRVRERVADDGGIRREGFVVRRRETPGDPYYRLESQDGEWLLKEWFAEDSLEHVVDL